MLHSKNTPRAKSALTRIVQTKLKRTGGYLRKAFAIMACALIFMVFAPAVAIAGPFDCDGNIYQVQSGQLRIFDPIISSYVDVGVPQGAYNAVGYNSNDDFAYGVRSNDVYRIHGDGMIEFLYDTNFSSFAGDVDDNNHLWLRRSASSYTAVNLLTGATNTVNFTGSVVNAADVAYIQDGTTNYLIAPGTSSVGYLNLDTGTSIVKPLTGIPDTGAFGASWTDKAGRMFTFNNGTGKIYEIFDLFTPAPFAELVAQGDPSGSNDGFACIKASFPNLPPLAFNDDYVTPLDVAVNSNVLQDNGNGADEDPESGVLTVNTTPVSGPSNGSVVLSANGDFTYTPAAGFFGIDTFDYIITDPSGLTATATVTILIEKADIAITKLASKDTDAEAGDVITYTYTVTNTGNVTLNNVHVTDVHSGSGALSAITPSSVTLDEGESQDFTATYTVTQADIEAETDLTNTATAHATPVTGSITEPSADEVVDLIDVAPAMTMAKTASDDTDVTVGTVITYTYAVENTGNVTMSAVSISDSHSGSGALSAITPASVDLAPGDSQDFTATYTVTQSDIDAGTDITNTATLAASPATGSYTPITADEVVDLDDVAPDFAVTKTASDTADVAVGDVITYTYDFENTGNVPLSNISVSDVHSGAGALSAITPASVASLPIGQSASFTATYTVTQADIDAGADITNTASFAASSPAGALPVQTANESVDLADAAPALTFTKVADQTADAALGDTITYTYTATNTGNVSINAVSVSDSHSGSGALSAITPASVDLAPGASQVFTASYVITQADIDAATDITNTATVSATPATGTLPVITADESVDLDDAAPALTFTKVADQTADAALGDTITYTYTATNTGNVSINAVSVSDSHSGFGALSAITPASVDLAPGDSQDFTATYVITQADIDAATDITNTATVSASPATGTLPTITADESVDLDDAAPSMTFTKVADITADVAVGDTITYTYTATNTGNVSINAVSVSDSHSGSGSLSAITPASVDLAPGDSQDFTATYVITQADIDAATDITNTATVSATPATGTLPVITADESVDLDDAAPSMTFTKVADITADVAVGDTVTYTYTATNTGNVSINAVSVSDSHSGSGSLSAITPASVDLAPGASQDFTATYVITQADIDAASDITNTATVSATPATGTLPAITADESVDVADATPALTMTKMASDTTDVAVGDVITYSYEVTNSGNVSMSGVSISDSHSGSGSLSAITPASVDLAPGASQTFTATYVVTQADIDAATDITNTATANATPATGTYTPVTADEVVDVADAAPALSFTKAADDTTDVTAGQTITYTYTASNTGNVTMSGVSISDSHSGSGALSAITPASVDLAPGDSQIFTATYIVTQADIDAATDITNTATANATPATGTYTPVTADEVVDVADAAPAAALTKTASDTTDVAAGDTITYSYELTNTGNVAINNASISDAHSGTGTLSAITPASVATLAPGDSQIFTATYVVTQADIEAESDITNTATLSATPASGTLPATSADESVDLADAAPSMTFTKVADITADVAVGDTITYTYTATNTGNVTINAVSVSDSHSGTGALSAITPASVDLAPGASQDFTATYVITQADVDAASDITNTATVSATPATGTLPTITADESVDLADPAPALTFTKLADVTADAAVGDTITYTYTATNTGNVSISAVSVSDSHSGTGTLSAITPASVDLAPGASQDFTATYVITQADIDAASDITNTATVSATPATGTLPTITADESVDLADPAPALTMTKTASDTTDVAAGDVITYSYEVTNSGNISIDNVSVSDVHSGSGALSAITPASVSLAPGASQTFTATYTVTQADIDAAADITNTATATGDPSTGVLADVSDTETVSPDSPAPSADMTKTADITSDVAVGDTITYSYVLANTGNVSLNAVSLSDSHSGTGTLSAITPASVTTLAPGASQTFTATYTVTQADIDAGADITNTATLTASPASGSLAPVTADETVDLDDVMPDFAVSKTASITADVAVGDVITYTYNFENTGNVTLSNISVSDVHSGSGALSAITPASVASLPVGQSATFTATYTVTQADIDAATDITNTATFAASSPAGPLPTQTADESVDLDDPAPSMEFTKVADQPTNAAVGDIITYTYTATNTGNVSMSNVSVSDVHSGSGSLSAITPASVASLPIGESATFTATYVITQADIDAGVPVTNVATLDATPAAGTLPPVTDDASVSPETGNGSISFVKTAITSDFTAVGDVLDYEYVVTNTGNVTVSSIAVTDDKIATVSCPVTTLAPTETVTCTASYSVTQADLDAGSVLNNASATANSPSGPVPTQDDQVVVDAIQSPAMTLVKTAIETSFAAVGDVLSYEYVVTNTGNVEITALTVSDDKIAVVSCPVTVLAPTESTTCTATYSVTQADIDAGSVTNIASATGDPAGGTLTDAEASETVNADQDPAMDIVKTATDVNFENPGDITTYEYVVTNTGNTTLTDPITVNDNLVTVTCPALPAGGLAPAASLTCTSSYTVTQADLDNGSVTNLATASSGALSSPQTSETIPADQDPALTIVKRAISTDFTAAGDVLSYEFDVTNTGNLTLTGGIDVIDDKIGTISCVTGNLTPTQTQTCTATYVVTQADMDAGTVTNQAYAENGSITSPSVDATVTGTFDPSLSFDKRAVDTDMNAAGDILTYEYDVENTGNVTISDLSVSDDKIASVSCPVTTLAPAETVTCTASYVVTQADIDAGSVTNNASVDGTPAGGALTPPSDSETVNSDQSPELTLDKRALDTTFNAAGDILNYEYDVTNSGNVTMSNIVVSDNLIPTLNCPQTTLLPGESMTCEGSYTVTQADVDATSVTNIASVDADPAGGVFTPPTDSVTVGGDPMPSLSLVKQAGASDFTQAGETLSYTYTVVNTGNVSINNLVVSDDKIAAVSCPATTLLPGEQMICSADYVTTQADVDAGSVTNNASVDGDASGGTLQPAEDAVTVNATQDSMLAIEKTAVDTAFAAPGDVITYEYVVTNTGNTTITDPITVSDDKIATVNCPALAASGLAPTDSLTCTGQYAVTQADIDAGFVTNLAAASDGNVASDVAQETVNATQAPSLDVVKTATQTSFNAVGDVLSYDYVVTNTGNTTITNAISVADDKIPSVNCPALPAGGLLPTQSMTCQADYTVTQTDIDAGEVVNIATASDGTTTSDPVTERVDAQRQEGMDVVKTATEVNFTAPGDLVSYEYVITNTGNTTLTAPITVSDNRIATVNCPALPAGGLAPASTLTCTAQYVVTQNDLDVGSVTNIASATDGTTTSTLTSETIPASALPALTMAKTSTDSSFSAVGDVLTYSFEIENAGNVTLVGAIEIVDNKIGRIECFVGNFAPGQVETCTADYVVTQADLDAGFVTNDAYAENDGATSPPDSVTIDADQMPSVSLDKSATVFTFAAVGDVLSYEYLVTNTGNTTITQPITVSDDKITSVSCPALPTGGLAPTQSVTCEADYIVTQADIDLGTVTNIASATDGVIDPATDTVMVSADQMAALSMTKTALTSDFAAVGDILSYEYVVTNIGNTTITDPVTVSDDKIASVSCPTIPAGGLVPGASLTCSADYLVTQDDIDAGSVTNIASASDGTTTSPSDSVTVDAGQNPMMSVTKEVSDLVQVSGPIYDVRYTMTMQNTGNVTLTDLGLSDDLVSILAPATLVNTPVVNAQNFDGNGSANAAFDGQSDIRLLIGDNQLLVGNTGIVTIDMRIDTSNGGPATANTAIGSANELTDTVPSNDPNETPETPDDVNPTPLVITDTDGDGVPDYLESAINDRDGDGVPDSEDYDPTGYFYCEENGAILPGGLIIVSGPAGSNATVGTSNNITIVQDGSNGYFQFYVTEPGRYSITPQYPQTGIPSTARLAQTNALDATSLLPSNPGVLGSSEFGNTGVLADFSEAVNDPFYFEFDIEAGDPAILMNNIPMALCGNASLSAAKITTSEPERQNDGRYSVSYELTATNTGETLVQSVNLEDDLSVAFGAGNFEIVSAELTDAPVDFAATINAQYDGVTDIALLSDGGELDVNERVEITLDLLVAATTSGEYQNTVSANGISALDALSAGNGLTKLEDLVTASDSAAITLESLSDASALRVTKTAQPRTVQIGDPILYTIGVRNESASSMGDLRVTDRLPAGFTYVPGSATLSTDTDTFALEPTVQSRGVLTWDITSLNAAPFDGLGAGEQINVNLRALAGTNVTFGAHENRAYVESLTNGSRSNVASAVVDYIPEPTFDCTPVIGRVFDDVNHNGYPDDGEPGLPAVRLVSVNGDIITTDEHGRYHIPCAIIADNERGSNFLLKTDVRSLPLGYAPTSENPRVVRATRGKFVKMNFAAAYMPKLRIDLYAADFDALNGKLVDGAAKRVFARLASMPNTERAVVIYHAAEDEGMEMARSRLALTRDYVLSVKSETLSDIALQASWGEAAEYNANILSGDGHNYTHALSDERRINRDSTPLGDHEQDQSYNRDRDHDGARTVSTGLRGDRNDEDFDDDTHAALPGRSESGEYNSSRPSRLQRWVGWTNSSSAYADGMEIETTVTGLNAVKRLNVGANVVNMNGKRQIVANSYWNYDRFIERAEVRLFEENTSTRGLPVTGASVLDHVATIDVNSLKGQYLYVLRVYDAEGSFDETSPKLIDLGDAEFDITPEEANARADDAFGADTLLVDNIRVRGGAVRVYGRNVAGTTATVFGQAVRVDEEGRFVAESLMPIGKQDVEVVVAGENGQQHRVMRSVTVKDKDTFYVGLIEATIGERASVDADGEREYAQGRAAFYVRSRLSDKYSLTATADTGEADIEDILSNFDQKDVRHLLRRLDPDRYYPVYGDDSVIEEDAPTSGKFYARIERDDDYALWGNYRATFNDTEFGRVNRTLYGAKLRWDSNANPTSYGDERSVIEGFVAEGGSRAARDELRGTGGSVYYLRHGDINIGGEIVKVEIRDEISGLVLETRRLVYGTDYDIDYIQGRILLSRPLASTGNTSRLFTDGNLSGNAQILVVDYEYSPVLGDDNSAVYGLRGSHWLGDSLKIGATYNHDSDGGAESDLYGLDATLQFTAGSYVKAEIAQSEGRGVTTFRSNDGGFSYRDETVTTQAGPATAFALEAAANFRELGFDLDGTAFAYLRDRQAGFAGYGEGSDTHITQYGGGITLDVSDNLSITGRADISDDQTVGTNSFAEISGEYDFNDMMSLSAGLSYGDDGRGQSGTAVGARADYAFSDDSKVYVFGQLGVQGDNTRTTDRIGAGLETRVSEKVYLGGEVSTGEDGLGATASVRYAGKDGDELYLAYELPLRSNVSDNFGTLNLGARRRYNDVLSVYGEERFHYDAQGLSGLTHAYGVNYQPSRGFSFGASGEFGEVEDLDRLALSANAGFKDEYMQAGIEGEYRTDENTVTGDVRDTWLLRTTALYQPNDELRLQGKYNMAFSDATNDAFGLQGFNQAKFTEGSLAAAYRPIWDDRLNVLAKYVYLSDLSPSTQSFGGEAINYKQRSQITSIDASYNISERWTLGGKYGYRTGELTSSRTTNDFTESEAELWVGRVDWHVVNDWDAVFEARHLNIGDGITIRTGGLAGIYRHINDNAKIGGGIVWGGIEEEYLAAQDDDGIGWYLNVIGKF